MGYIEYRDGKQIVRCKSCRVEIAINSRRLPTYCEIVLAMREPDGQLSKHETDLCKACKARLWTDGPRLGELEAIWADDLDQFGETALHAGGGLLEIRQALARQAARTPLRVLHEASRGEVG